MLEELFGSKAERPDAALKAKHFLKNKLAEIRVIATDELDIEKPYKKRQCDAASTLIGMMQMGGRIKNTLIAEELAKMIVNN